MSTPASAVVERAASALARLRSTHVVHAAGRTFPAEVLIWGTVGPPTGVSWLDRPSRWRATARLSRNAPIREGWPDVLGLAIRLHREPQRPMDLLLNSSAAAPVLRHLSLPRRRFTGTYSSMMSLRAGRRRLYLAALADPNSPDLGRSLAEVSAVANAQGARLVLAVATAFGPWRPFGQLRLDGESGTREDAELAFDPVGNVPPGLRMAGPLAWLRSAGYRGSRRGRGAAARSGSSSGVPV
jgi:hypothetical protein